MGFRTFSQIKKRRKDSRSWKGLSPVTATQLRYGTREGLAFFVIVVPPSSFRLCNTASPYSIAALISLSLSLSLSSDESGVVGIVKVCSQAYDSTAFPAQPFCGAKKRGWLGICMYVLYQVISQFVSQLTLTSLSGVCSFR